jgi:Protein of unknown function (DUF2637)
MTSLRFSELPAHLRAILVVALLATIAIAVGAFVVSYAALWDLARESGVVDRPVAWVWPLLVDAMLIVAELAFVAAAAVGANRLLPAVFMVVLGAASIWFNLIRAPADQGVRLVAAVPPAVSIGSTILIAFLVKILAAAMGRPLTYLPPPPPAAGLLGGPLPGVIYRPDAAGWNVPNPGLPAGWPQGPSGQSRAGHHLPENRHNGQPGLAAGGGGGPAGQTKRQRIEEYLDWLGPQELQNLTVRELTAELASQGLEVTERYVKQILDQQRPPPQPRRRGSGTRRPRR